MISRLSSAKQYLTPVLDVDELQNESDVEQKLVYPFLIGSGYLGLPTSWIRTKEYMSPTEIDKVAGKRFGYFPDYSVWIGGIPLLIIEAKAPDVSIKLAIREARLYANEINKRYPPNVNPIAFVVGCNGAEFALSPVDSENLLISPAKDLSPGTAVLDVFVREIGKQALADREKSLSPNFQGRPTYSVSSFMGGQSRVEALLGVNEFAEPLFTTITKYFGSTSEETPDEVIEKAYVTSDEIGRYEGVLETYLKDRTARNLGNQVKTIETSRSQASGISFEIKRFAENPNHYSRVQLIIGAVGAGKSTFIRRFYNKLLATDVRSKTLWSFLNFNVLTPNAKLSEWVAQQFVESLASINQIEIYDFDLLEKVFSVELNRFDHGANKRLKDIDPVEFERRRSQHLDDLSKNWTELAKAISRHFSGEGGKGIVVVFDNVDKRSREQQLEIFEAAQWFKEISRALVLINLRDSTFEAHRFEPPLDAFVNAINFYITPPRFAQVIRKRLELVLEILPSEVAEQQEYSLSSGYKIKYPSSRLGEFLMTIYLSLFDQRSAKIGSALEALVAKDVRRALGMFADILVSPHIPTSQITGTMLTQGQYRIQEYRIIRALMRQRYRFYNGRASYIRNIIDLNVDHDRPSNFLYADILEFLIRNRKVRIDFAQEGYATVATLKSRMSTAGYDPEDVGSSIETLAEWGLIEPESLVIDKFADEDAVRMHATGFIHMRFFLERLEYLVGITTDMRFLSRDTAESIGRTWSGQMSVSDLPRGSTVQIFNALKSYMEHEYRRRCKRHAFYEEVGLGGKVVLEALNRAANHLSRKN